MRPHPLLLLFPRIPRVSRGNSRPYRARCVIAFPRTPHSSLHGVPQDVLRSPPRPCSASAQPPRLRLRPDLYLRPRLRGLALRHRQRRPPHQPASSALRIPGPSLRLHQRPLYRRHRTPCPPPPSTPASGSSSWPPPSPPSPPLTASLDGGTNYAYGFAFTGTGTSPLTLTTGHQRPGR